MAIAVSMTASFDANLAREVGLPAAILYNQLLYISQTDMVQGYDEDGWFYYKAETFERDTTFKKDTYSNAVKALEKAGYIRKQRMYIKNTSVSVNHYQFAKTYIPNSDEIGIQEFGRNRNSIYRKNNIENKLEFAEPDLASQPSAGGSAVANAPADTNSSSHDFSVQPNSGSEPVSPTADGFSSLTEKSGGSRSALNAGGVVKNTTPFDGEVRDVKPKKDMLTAKAFALAKELMGIIDPNDKDIVPVAKLVKNALARGQTPEQLHYVARASRSDSWYYDKPATTVLGREGIKTLLAKQKKKESDTPSGLNAVARAYWG